jgi:hypothetical protein
MGGRDADAAVRQETAVATINRRDAIRFFQVFDTYKGYIRVATTRTYRENVTAVLLAVPPGPIALTVAT